MESTSILEMIEFILCHFFVSSNWLAVGQIKCNVIAHRSSNNYKVQRYSSLILPLAPPRPANGRQGGYLMLARFGRATNK